MKVEIQSDGFNDFNLLSEVDCTRFAKDDNGRVYFTLTDHWMVYDPILKDVARVKNSSFVRVTPLPYGTKLTLTLERPLGELCHSIL